MATSRSVDPETLKKGDKIKISVKGKPPHSYEGILFEVKESRQYRGCDWFVKVQAIVSDSGDNISPRQRRDIDYVQDTYRSNTQFYPSVRVIFLLF